MPKRFLMSLAKRLALRFLPASARFLLERRYYARAVRRFWEPDIVPIRLLVGPGELAIDAGANLGWYTRVLSGLVGPRGRVLALEPVPSTHRLLTAVIESLGLANVRAECCALSDRPGTLTMEVPSGANGAASHYLARVTSSGSSAGRFNVPARTLDELVDPAEAARCTFIKCDVEGHELAALRGGTRLLGRAKPALLVELSGGAPERLELRGFLEEQGYAPWWFDGAHLRPFAQGDKPINLLFLQPAQIERLASLRLAGAVA